jgi:7-cyano-7-deazaguanine synthase
MKFNAFVSLSGGMDSAVVLANTIEKSGYEPDKIMAVGFTYGSKHNQWENAMAAQLCDHYGVKFELIDLRGVMNHFKSNLLQSGGPVPEGHYEAESMRQTVVPGRNTIMVSIIAGLAESHGEPAPPMRRGGILLPNKYIPIFIGVHAGDHHIYPDCRPNWVSAIQETIKHSTEDKILVVAPFLYVTKHFILETGLKFGVPFEMTRTCYNDQPVACGKCGSCQERLEAFHKADKTDPLEYESQELLPKTT